MAIVLMACGEAGCGLEFAGPDAAHELVQHSDTHRWQPMPPGDENVYGVVLMDGSPVRRLCGRPTIDPERGYWHVMCGEPATQRRPVPNGRHEYACDQHTGSAR